MNGRHDELRHPEPGDPGSALHGDSFAQLVRENQAWVRGFLRARLRDWASADDLAQDVFVTAYLKRGSFRGASSVETWLHGIAQNHLRNFLRKHRETAAGGSEDLQLLLEEGCDPAEGARSPQGRLDALMECLERLPEHSRALLDARYVRGRSVREISEQTGTGYSALSMRFQRLRELLAECIRNQLERSEA